MERKKIFNIANYKDTPEIKFGMLCRTEDEANKELIDILLK